MEAQESSGDHTKVFEEGKNLLIEFDVWRCSFQEELADFVWESTWDILFLNIN